MKTVKQVNRLIWPVAILAALFMLGCGNSVTGAAGSSPLETAGVASLGTTSQFHGVILSQSSITMNTGASATT